MGWSYLFICQVCLLLWNISGFPTGEPATDSLLQVPYVYQEGKLCGPASLAMVLQYWGKSETQHTIEKRLPEGSLTNRGVTPEYLKDAAEQLGFTAFIYRGDFTDIKHHLDKGRPLIIQIQSSRLLGTFHYLVVVGVEDENQSLVVHDPFRSQYQRVKSSDLAKKWEETNFLSILVLPQ